jgi:hypothetical protein
MFSVAIFVWLPAGLTANHVESTVGEKGACEAVALLVCIAISPLTILTATLAIDNIYNGVRGFKIFTMD